jgi:RNA polymerase sigma-70 factor (ECF subfamily)
MDDCQLIKATLQGNLQAFAQLICVYQHTLLAVAYQMIGRTESAEDLVQAVFIEAYHNLSTLTAHRQLRLWLFSTLRGKCHQHLLLQHSTKVLFDEGDSRVEPQDAFSPDLALIDQLPLADRMLVAARYLQQLSYREIADMLDMSEAKVRQQCQHTRVHLRLLVRRDRDEERIIQQALRIFTTEIPVDVRARVIHEVGR